MPVTNNLGQYLDSMLLPGAPTPWTPDTMGTDTAALSAHNVEYQSSPGVILPVSFYVSSIVAAFQVRHIRGNFTSTPPPEVIPSNRFHIYTTDHAFTATEPGAQSLGALQAAHYNPEGTLLYQRTSQFSLAYTLPAPIDPIILEGSFDEFRYAYVEESIETDVLTENQLVTTFERTFHGYRIYAWSWDPQNFNVSDPPTVQIVYQHTLAYTIRAVPFVPPVSQRKTVSSITTTAALFLLGSLFLGAATARRPRKLT